MFYSIRKVLFDWVLVKLSRLDIDELRLKGWKFILSGIMDFFSLSLLTKISTLEFILKRRHYIYIPNFIFILQQNVTFAHFLVLSVHNWLNVKIFYRCEAFSFRIPLRVQTSIRWLNGRMLIYIFNYVWSSKILLLNKSLWLNSFF